MRRLETLPCADDPPHCLETQPPAPQNNEPPLASGSRWRWMENRWVALSVTVLMSVAGFWTCSHVADQMLAEKWSLYLEAYLAQIGLNTSPVEFTHLLRSCALLWFYPVALRLGPGRTAIWFGLVGVWFWLAFPLTSYLYPRAIELGREMEFASSLNGLRWALPCLALIGRRSRPWLAVPAGASVTLFTYFYFVWNPSFGTGTLLWPTLNSLPYAAILIFGTTLIPKKLAP